MSTPNLSQEMEAVIGVLVRTPHGATLNQINAGLKEPQPMRALQFNISQLLGMKRIRSDRSKGVTLFFVAQPTGGSGKKGETGDVSVTPKNDQTAAPGDKPAGAPSSDSPAVVQTPPPSTGAQTSPVSAVPASTTIQSPMAQQPKNPPQMTSSTGAPQNCSVNAVVPATPSAKQNPADSSASMPPRPSVSEKTNMPPSALPTASIDDAAKGQFADEFDGCLYDIVSHVCVRVSAIAMLQQVAREKFAASKDQRAFVAYGKARLEALTAEEAEEYGIQPEQYDFWRDQYFESDLGHQAPSAEHDSTISSQAADESEVRRRSSSGAAIPATPKGWAKSLSKLIDPLVPEELRPYVRGVLVIAGAALLTPAISLMSGYPWQTIAVIAAVVVVAAVVLWARKQLRTTPVSVADQIPGAGAPPGTGQIQSAGGSAQTAGVGLTRGAAPTDPGTPSVVLSRPRSRRAVYAFAVGGIALVAAIAAIVFYWQIGKRPSEVDVRAWLVKSVAPLPVRVAGLDLTYASTGSAGSVFHYQARLETLEPLFKRIDTAQYLRAHAPTEIVAVEAAEKLLKGPNGARIRAAISSTESDSHISGSQIADTILVETVTPPGTTTMVSGTATAWRQNDLWRFTGSAPALDRHTLIGEPKPATALAVEFPEDEARLTAAVAERAAYAVKVQAAASVLAAELERERQQKADALAQLVQRGTWLTGIVVDTTKSESRRVLLEVADCSTSSHQITLLLRNESGWSNVRPFTGTWIVDADVETCTAKLRTSSFDRIPNAGAPLDDTNTFYVTLLFRLDGTVEADARNWQLSRVDTEDIAKAKEVFGYGRDTVVKDSGVTSKVTDPQSLGSPAVTSINRPDDTPASQAPVLSSADLTFFSIAIAGTAYVHAGGTWIRLPQNGAKAIQNAPQKLTGLLQNLGSFEDRLAGKSPTPSTTEIAEIRFDGIETVPVVPAKEVVIVYVGPLTPFTAADVARHPELKDYPVMELAREKTLSNGVRYASLYRVASGFLGFGTSRVMGTTVDQSVPNLTIFRCTASLRHGQYAVACGSKSYEVAIE